MKRLLLALSFLIVGASFAYAQSPVITQPKGVTSYNGSGNIVSTNTFQNVFLASSGRFGCLIQNKSGSNNMFIYFGPIANATTPNSLLVAAGR